MPRGGRRPGAGRKPKVKCAAELVEAFAVGETPLDFMKAEVLLSVLLCLKRPDDGLRSLACGVAQSSPTPVRQVSNNELLSISGVSTYRVALTERDAFGLALSSACR
jgi:hypothetical protein